MELHGAGLERMLEIVRANGDSGQLILDSLGRDDMVSSLLVLYGLHPVGIGVCPRLQQRHLHFGDQSTVEDHFHIASHRSFLKRLQILKLHRCI